MSGPIAVWLARCGREIGVLDGLPTPFELELAGKYEEAEDAWATIGRTYEGAMALASSEDPPLLRRALEALQSLGAEAAAAAVVRKMKTLGIKAVPRGPRSTTKAHPFKLTMREQEILDLLSEGLANNEISERLVISEKTVDHHVSAVLSKMGVRSRAAAVREAGRAGLLAAK
jgi:DNA-binding NarL/FixJ family response regulator